MQNSVPLKWIIFFTGLILLSCTEPVVDLGELGLKSDTSSNSSETTTEDSESDVDDSDSFTEDSDTSASNCGPDEMNPPVGMICVRGVDYEDGKEQLVVGRPIRFQLFPQGCYSSSNTIVVENLCDIANLESGQIELVSKICLYNRAEKVSTPDCSGGGFSECELESLEAGNYTLTVDDLTFKFTMPGELNVRSRTNCVGELY